MEWCRIVKWFGHFEEICENEIAMIYRDRIDVDSSRQPPVEWEDRMVEYLRIVKVGR